MPIPTPCTNICTLDAAGRTCIGCGRTLDEIARWGSMAEAERGAIMARLTAALGAARADNAAVKR